jgi:hypothetical protein
MLTRLPLLRPIWMTQSFGRETMYVEPPVSWIFLISLIGGLLLNAIRGT